MEWNGEVGDIEELWALSTGRRQKEDTGVLGLAAVLNLNSK